MGDSFNSRLKFKFLSNYRSLKFNILIPFSILFLITVTVILSNNYYNNSNEILELSNEFFNQISDNIIEETKNYLKPLSIVVNLNSQIFQKGIFSSTKSVNSLKDINIPSVDRITNLESYFIEIMKAYPQIYTLYIGDEKGYFLEVQRQTTNSLNILNLDRVDNKLQLLSSKVIDNTGRIMRIEIPAKYKTYNHKTRLWYKGAKETGNVYWTDMYIFFLSGKPGITVSYPINNRNGELVGVIGADIELSELSKFLMTLKVKKSGVVAIIDNKDKVIAYSGNLLKLIKNEEDKFRAISFDELDIDWLVGSLKEHRKRGETQIKYEYNQKRYIVSYISFPKDFRKDWEIVIGIPEDDFIGGLKTNNNISIVISIVIMLIGILLILPISNKISDPINHLIKDIEEIKNFNFIERSSINSDIFEFQVLGNSFEKMALDLKKSKEDLESWNKELEEKVSQRTKELQKSKEELEDAYRQLKETQAHLIQSEKMTSLGQMVAGIAHEINNPVNFVSTGSDNLLNKIKELDNMLFDLMDEEEKDSQVGQILTEKLDSMKKLIGIIKTGTERIVKIVTSLRNFSRLDEAERKDVDLHEGIDSTLDLLHFQIKNRIDLHKDYGDLPLYECNSSQLNQVFMNILNNACNAIVGNGDIWIKTYLEKIYIVIEISDSGSGIPEKIKNKIFDPFFTTKPVGKGTGLGLSISYGIIKGHDGIIEVESKEGKGTTFFIKLPVKRSHKDAAV